MKFLSNLAVGLSVTIGLLTVTTKAVPVVSSLCLSPDTLISDSSAAGRNQV